MDTGLLDSHAMFGINAPRRDRINFRKRVTCSPIHVRDLAESYNDTQTGEEYLRLYLGPIPGIWNYTYQYNVRTERIGIGYSLQ